MQQTEVRPVIPVERLQTLFSKRRKTQCIGRVNGDDVKQQENDKGQNKPSDSDPLEARDKYEDCNQGEWEFKAPNIIRYGLANNLSNRNGETRCEVVWL